MIKMKDGRSSTLISFDCSLLKRYGSIYVVSKNFTEKEKPTRIK